MSEGVIVRSFSGGELSPALAARGDIAKYAVGLRRCRNFIVQRHGGVANRPGFRFVEECATASSNVRLIRYVSEVEGQSVLIEAGTGYLRFFNNGSAVVVASAPAWDGVTAYVIGDLVSSGGVIYWAKADGTNHAPPDAAFWYPLPAGNILEIPTNFNQLGVFNWVQSGRTITFTHPLVRPADLTYLSLTHWILRDVDTKPKVLPPTGIVLTGTAAGARSYGYVVTAAAPNTYEESEASAQVIGAAVLEPTPAAPHIITWTPVLTPPVTGTASPEYYVYCDPYGNGTYGFIGTSTGIASFRNVGIAPDFTATPPLAQTKFVTAGDYPTTCAYHQQRRFFGNTNDLPDAGFASRVGFADNFGISSPLQDDDAISFRIAGNNHNPIRHLIALKQLLVLTGAGEWRLNGGVDGVLTPNTLGLDQETYAGISSVRPVVVGNSIIYVQARGEIIRDLEFDQKVEGLAGRDLTVFAGHLFDGKTINGIDFQQSANSVVWACRSDGTLLGLTYVREQDIWAWHRHDTGALGWFEQVCVVPEIGQDVVYCIVRRTVNGVIRRYIEKLESREIVSYNRDAFFVDSGLSYAGAPVLSVAGLDHLEGQVVAVLADGVVLYNGDPSGALAGSFTVVGGALTLPAPAAPATGYSNIHAGLSIRFAEIETMDLDINGSNVRDKKKRVASLTAILHESARVFWAGPDEAHLTQYGRAEYDPTDVSFSGQVELNVQSRFNDNGRVFIRHTEPLPLTVLGIIPSVELGG